ncbi:MAG: hypothetical protein JWP76_6027 [Dactylosporangium sp.]|jgi:hypothetical protein|nr:hypothetical protein [Dactylosporangium sp.]
MVLTVAVRMGEERRGHSRRTVLRAALGGMAAAVPLTACDSPQQAARRQQIPDPLNPFYHDTAALLGRYEATIAAQPGLTARLGPLRDAHRAHLQALAREIGPGLSGPSTGDPSSTTVPTGSGGASNEPATLATLLAAEKNSSEAARAACLRAPSYRAALLGSIAAARASHVAVLS